MKQRRNSKLVTKQSDGTFVLKVLLYIIVGAQWLYITNPDKGQQYPIPIGLVIGLFFASHEHFKLDRKIEYAVLLASMFVSFWLPMGITIVR